MPAQRLGTTPVPIRRFDVCGRDSDSAPQFVRHVGLAVAERADHSPGDSLPLVHMQPPLGIETDGDGDPVDTVGSVPLDAPALRQIEVYVDELRLELDAEKARPIRQYVIVPHAAPATADIPFRRFNCAGFAIEAYREAGINLVVTNPAGLPPVDLQTLETAYPDRRSQLRNAKLRQLLGLPGDGPWPVVLPGYVLNALARTTEEIHRESYQPIPGDEFFPPRR